MPKAAFGPPPSRRICPTISMRLPFAAGAQGEHMESLTKATERNKVLAVGERLPDAAELHLWRSKLNWGEMCHNERQEAFSHGRDENLGTASVP